jgi:hypothetical protein
MCAKTMKSVIGLCLLTTQLLTFSTAFAKSGGAIAGGGGDTLVNKETGEIISIADPMASESKQGKRILLPQVLKDELTKISNIAASYYFYNYRFNYLTSNDTAVYILVDELPSTDICQERIKYKSTNGTDLEISPTACTSGKTTWIKKSDYEKLLKKDSKRELALLIVHEGLRRVQNLSSDDLVAITNGLRVALNAFDSQSIGKMTPLKAEETTALSAMVESILYNGLAWQDGVEYLKLANQMVQDFEVTDLGGVVEKGATVQPTAKIGAGVRINSKSTVGSNVKMAGSLITYAGRYLEENSAKIGNNVNLNNSILHFSLDGEIATDSIIIKSNVYVQRKFGKNLRIINSTLKVDNVDNDVSIIASNVQGKIDVKEDTLIKNSSLTFEPYEQTTILGKNLSLINFNDALFKIKSQGFGGMLKGGFKSSKIEFVDGLALDLDGASLCEGGTSNKFSPYDGAYSKITNLADLQNACLRK